MRREDIEVEVGAVEGDDPFSVLERLCKGLDVCCVPYGNALGGVGDRAGDGRGAASDFAPAPGDVDVLS